MERRASKEFCKGEAPFLLQTYIRWDACKLRSFFVYYMNMIDTGVEERSGRQEC